MGRGLSQLCVFQAHCHGPSLLFSYHLAQEVRMIWFLGDPGDSDLHCEGCAAGHELASPCWTLQGPELNALHQEAPISPRML